MLRIIQKCIAPDCGLPVRSDVFEDVKVTDRIINRMTIQQGGAIVVKFSADEPRCLVVTAKREPAHWLFPKGHIEAGETPDQTAVREALEEAGVTGRVLERLGDTTFSLGTNDVNVHYFLLEYVAQDDAAEGRQVRWCTRSEAIRLLTFPKLRQLLERAWPRVLSLDRARR
jgi:8-oxo-dGTP pyrophosphatase MutT (NUDIX family)